MIYTHHTHTTYAHAYNISWHRVRTKQNRHTSMYIPYVRTHTIGRRHTIPLVKLALRADALELLHRAQVARHQVIVRAVQALLVWFWPRKQIKIRSWMIWCGTYKKEKHSNFKYNRESVPIWSGLAVMCSRNSLCFEIVKIFCCVICGKSSSTYTAGAMPRV